MEFTKNPLQGVHIGQGSDKGRKKSTNAILDADGNVLLDRVGYEWSENDQMGYDLLMKSMDYEYYGDLMNYENEYNSPVEQAKRMREAGLNPDLIGTSNFQSSDAGSNASAPATTLNEGAESARKAATTLSIAKEFFNVLPQAIQMYTQMKSSLQQSQMNEIQIAKGVDQLARHEIGTQFTLDQLGSDSIPAPHLQHYKNQRLQDAIQSRISQYTFNKNRKDVPKSFVYDAQRASEANRQDFLGLLASYGYNVDDDVLLGTIREMNTVIANATKSKAKYQDDYLSNKDGAQVAQTENQEAQKRQKEAENDVIADTLARANKMMKSDERGERLKGGLLFLVCYLMQNVSFSRFGGPKGPTSTISF